MYQGFSIVTEHKHSHFESSLLPARSRLLSICCESLCLVIMEKVLVHINDVSHVKWTTAKD